MTYRVLTPSGVIADGSWRRVRDIPDRISDRWDVYFDTSSAMILVTDDFGEEYEVPRWKL